MRLEAHHAVSKLPRANSGSRNGVACWLRRRRRRRRRACGGSGGGRQHGRGLLERTNLCRHLRRRPDSRGWKHLGRLHRCGATAWRRAGHQRGEESRFSATLTEYSFSNNLAPEFVFSGTVRPRSRIEATTSSGRGLFLDYRTGYDQAASPQVLAGRYQFDGDTVVSIDTAGTLTWTASADCTLTGSASPRPSGKNVFNLALTYVGPGCSHGNGTRITGVAHLDVTTTPARLVALGLRDDRVVGLVSPCCKAGRASPTAQRACTSPCTRTSPCASADASTCTSPRLRLAPAPTPAPAPAPPSSFQQGSFRRQVCAASGIPGSLSGTAVSAWRLCTAEVSGSTRRRLDPGG